MCMYRWDTRFLTWYAEALRAFEEACITRRDGSTFGSLTSVGNPLQTYRAQKTTMKPERFAFGARYFSQIAKEALKAPKDPAPRPGRVDSTIRTVQFTG